MQTDAVYIGLDLGTTGARAIAIDHEGRVLAQGKSLLIEHGNNHRDPGVWWSAACVAISDCVTGIDRSRVVAICVDGTSGTMLPIDASGKPLADARMYNDNCTDTTILEKIAAHAPLQSAAHGPSNGLAKVMLFQGLSGVQKVVHQADWIAGQLCGVYSSDDNNALKTGFDPVAGHWPDWIANTGVKQDLLVDVNRPGDSVAPLLSTIADKFQLPKSVKVIAGTTDGCASFLATGADKPGQGVSALGTTLTIKMLSDVPLFDPKSGVYSHHLLGFWLAGGASNTGGNVLLAHFTPEEMQELSLQIDPTSDSGLDYYPLLKPGERFPISDPTYAPRMTPVPDSKALYLQGMFEGIAKVEALAYSKLAALGGPAVQSVRSVGGGAQNNVWSLIRGRYLGVDMLEPINTEAAYGSARLAFYGINS